MSRVFLSLGSNIGDKLNYLIQAKQLLNNYPLTIVKESSYYETEPVGYLDQATFINQVIEIETNVSPLELLKFCQTVEKKLHRKREIRWGPRTIDIDILLFDQLTLQDEQLIIPHPRMTERAFVLVPLQELDPNIYISNKAINHWIVENGFNFKSEILKKI